MNRTKIIQARYGPIEYGQWIDVKPILNRFPDLPLQVSDIVFTDGEDGWPGKTKTLRLLVQENGDRVIREFQQGEIVSPDSLFPVPPKDESGSIKSDNYFTAGLQILSAKYGVDVNNFIDVTKRVRELVKNDSLDIIVNNSTLVPGQNPFRGKKKVLLLTYSYGGDQVTVERYEKDWLIIGQARREVPPAWKATANKKWNVTEVRLREPIDSREIKYEVHDSVNNDHVHDFEQIEGQSAPQCGCGATRDYEITAPENVGQKAAKALEEFGRAVELLPVEARNYIANERSYPMSATALNDYLIRKFNISPQRLKAPMPIELNNFHRNDLAQLFAELGFKRGAEIGVAEGNYSEILLKANPACELLLVDPWHAYSENPQNKTKEKHEFAWAETTRKITPFKNARMVDKVSMVAVQDVEWDYLDYCYIDANHSFDYVMQDLIEWSKRVRSGGIVSGDDWYGLNPARWNDGGVVEAVQAYTNAHRINLWWLFQGHKSVDFMWVKP